MLRTEVHKIFGFEKTGGFWVIPRKLLKYAIFVPNIFAALF